MAINIKNIIDAIEAKVALGATSLIEKIALIDAVNTVNNYKGVKSYETEDDLPSFDSSNIGKISYVRYTGVDNYGSFYYGKNVDDKWVRLVSTADSAELAALASGGTIVAEEIVPITATYFPGSVAGYFAGGGDTSPAITTDVIEKFPFASDGSTTDVGNLTIARAYSSGHSSPTHGYAAGGTKTSPYINYTNIDKYAFASDGNATSGGTLGEPIAPYGAPNSARYGYRRPVGNSSSTDGYVSRGGQTTNTAQTYIRFRFPFAADTTSTTLPNFAKVMIAQSTGQNDTTAYMAGGTNPVAVTQTRNVDKFPFASDTNVSEIDQLSSTIKETAGGVSSPTHMYVANAEFRDLHRFSFSSDTRSAMVAYLIGTGYLSGFDSKINHENNGQRLDACENSAVSGETAGYLTGGPYRQTERFPYANESLNVVLSEQQSVIAGLYIQARSSSQN
jgi:hypothetical protein